MGGGGGGVETLPVLCATTVLGVGALICSLRMTHSPFFSLFFCLFRNPVGLGESDLSQDGQYLSLSAHSQCG